MGKAAKTAKTATEGRTLAATNERFAKLAKAFAAVPGVTQSGKGFGSTGLKVNGKLFAFVSSQGGFVLKLPKERVAALVKAGQGDQFDPGHGRVMKEWVVVTSTRVNWLSLAREAHGFVLGLKS